MALTKSRFYTLTVAESALGLELTPANLGFNPSHEFSKIQIATNDFGGSFSIELSLPGNPNYYPLELLSTPVGGTDIVIIDPIGGKDPLFDAVKISFAGVTSDIEVYATFIK